MELLQGSTGLIGMNLAQTVIPLNRKLFKFILISRVILCKSRKYSVVIKLTLLSYPSDTYQTVLQNTKVCK